MPEAAKDTSPGGDQDRFLRTDHLMSDLRARSIRAGAVTLISQAFKFAVTMASIMVLARLLTPQDFGLIVMVTAITGFMGLLKDMGLPMATVQKPHVDHTQVSTLFWLNVVVSVLFMLLTAASAPGIAWFYQEPRLAWITVAFAGTFVFRGLTVQHQALLQRQLRFTALAAIEIGATLAGITVGVVSAWFGAGYWALVLMPATVGIVTAAGVWVLCGWRPGPPARNADIRSMLAFGGGLTGVHVLGYVTQNVDRVVIGRCFGTNELGYYTKAFSLLLRPLQQFFGPLGAVAIPTLSRLIGDPDRYRRTFLSILEITTMVTMPGIVFLAVNSDWLVEIVLGPQWTAVSRIFVILSFVGFLQPAAAMAGWIFITHGETGKWLRFCAVRAMVVFVSIAAGLPWGIVGVATCYSVSGVLIRVPATIWFAGRHGPIRPTDFCRTMAPFALASLGVLIALLTYRWWAGVHHPIIGVLLGSVITAGVYLLVLLAQPRGRRTLGNLKSFIPLLTGQ